MSLPGDPEVWLGAGRTLTSRRGTQLPNGRRTDEGMILKGPLPNASEELHECEHRTSTDVTTPFFPHREFADLLK